MFVSCETIQLLLSFANEINVNNNYISIKYRTITDCGYHISTLSKENHEKS